MTVIYTTARCAGCTTLKQILSRSPVPGVVFMDTVRIRTASVSSEPRRFQRPGSTVGYGWEPMIFSPGSECRMVLFEAILCKRGCM